MEFLRRIFRRRAAADRIAAQAACVALVARFEGFRASAYRCSAGRLTLGLGTTNLSPAARECGLVITESSTITRDRAMELLEADVGKLFDQAESALETPTRPWCCAALASLAYNVGWPRVARSAALRAIRDGKMADGEREFKEFRLVNGEVSRGLVNRRNAEWDMLEKGEC